MNKPAAYSSEPDCVGIARNAIGTQSGRNQKGIGSESSGPGGGVAGAGRVAAFHGHYADAIVKKNPLVLFLVETTGALSLEARAAIAYLHRLTKPRSARDGTLYGTARGATTSFRRHHTAAISSAVILADAETLLRRADRPLA